MGKREVRRDGGERGDDCSEDRAIGAVGGGGSGGGGDVVGEGAGGGEGNVAVKKAVKVAGRGGETVEEGGEGWTGDLNLLYSQIVHGCSEMPTIVPKGLTISYTMRL